MAVDGQLGWHGHDVGVADAEAALRLRLWPHRPATWRLGAGPGWWALGKPSAVGCAGRLSRSRPDGGELLARLIAAEPGFEAAWLRGVRLLGAAIGGRGRASAIEDSAASGVVVVVADAGVATQGAGPEAAAAAQAAALTAARGVSPFAAALPGMLPGAASLDSALAGGGGRSAWLAGIWGWPVHHSPAEHALRAGLQAEGVLTQLRGQRAERTLVELETDAAAELDIVALLRRRGLQVASTQGASAAPARSTTGRPSPLWPTAAPTDRVGEGDDVRQQRVAEADRWLWHRSRLRLGSESFACPPPAVFASWLHGEVEPEPARLARALRRRHDLIHSDVTDAIRCFDDESSLVIERYGSDLVVAIYDDVPPATGTPAALTTALQRQRQRALALADQLGFRTVWLKLRPRQANTVVDAVAAGLVPQLPLRDGGDGLRLPGGPGLRLIVEAGVRYIVDLADGLQTGIFLDQRDNRRRVQAEAAGRRLLNTFAYTCGFQVAAAVGGALHSLSIDASARAIERGRANLALNGVEDSARHETQKGDVFAWLPRLARRGERFDIVVLDPPTYAGVGKRRFSAGRDFAELTALAVPLVAADGWLLACINHAKIDSRRFEDMVREGCRRAGRTISLLQHQQPAPDHPGGRMKSMWVRLA